MKLLPLDYACKQQFSPKHIKWCRELQIVPDNKYSTPLPRPTPDILLHSWHSHDRLFPGLSSFQKKWQPENIWTQNIPVPTTQVFDICTRDDKRGSKQSKLVSKSSTQNQFSKIVTRFQIFYFFSPIHAKVQTNKQTNLRSPLQQRIGINQWNELYGRRCQINNATFITIIGHRRAIVWPHEQIENIDWMDFLLSAHGLHNCLRSKLKLLDSQEFEAFDFTEPVDFSTLIMQRYAVELVNYLLTPAHTSTRHQRAGRLINRTKRLWPPSKLKLLGITQPLRYIIVFKRTITYRSLRAVIERSSLFTVFMVYLYIIQLLGICCVLSSTMAECT